MQPRNCAGVEHLHSRLHPRSTKATKILAVLVKKNMQHCSTIPVLALGLAGPALATTLGVPHEVAQLSNSRFLSDFFQKLPLLNLQLSPSRCQWQLCRCLLSRCRYLQQAHTVLRLKVKCNEFSGTCSVDGKPEACRQW